MSIGAAALLEDDDRRGDQRVAELHVRWAVAVDLPERDAIAQVGLEGRAVVHVHEFGGDQPDGQTPIGQPGVAQQEEMSVEAGQAADRDAQPIQAMPWSRSLSSRARWWCRT